MYFSLPGPKFDSEIKIFFEQVHMSNLAVISFPEEEYTWMIMFSGFAGEEDMFTHAWGIYEMKSGSSGLPELAYEQCSEHL